MITKRNSQCTCGSGKKFKHCCIELYNERLKWNSLEESLRNKIQEYWEKFYHDQYIEDAIATFDKDIDFKDISERRLFFDWFIHDYIIKDNGKSSTTIIQKFVKNCHDYIDKEEEKNTLKLWADSAFRFYEVLDIKKGSGYTVTDVFGDQDKHLFLFDHSSSFTINKYDILYTMLYKVGDTLRPSGGLMVSPRRFLPFIKEYVMNTFQKFQSKYKRNIESRTNVEHENLYLNDYFRKESVSIIKYLDSLNSYPTITTAQGDLLVLSRSSFLIKNKRRFLSMLDSSKDFIELENEGNEVRYDWVEELDEGNISFLNNINNKDINNSDEEKQESNLSYQSEEIALHTILWVSVDDDNIQEHENIFNKDDGDGDIKKTDRYIPYRVLGNLYISRKTLEVECLSDFLLLRCNDLIQSLAGKYLKHLGNVYKDISSSSLSESNKEHLKSSVDDHEYHRENDDSDIKVPNTIGSSFKQMIENHYENWITTKNPRLGNKTPLQFAKTKKGKEMIKELLKEMENELARNNKSDLPPFPFERVKERLGL